MNVFAATRLDRRISLQLLLRLVLPALAWLSCTETPNQPTTSGVIPAIPSNVAASPGGSDTVGVYWAASSGAKSYNVYWSTTPAFTTQSATKRSFTSSPAKILGLAQNTRYYFMVTAVSDVGESAPSITVSATATNAMTLDLFYPSVSYFTIAGGGMILPDSVRIIAKIYSALYQVTSVSATIGSTTIALVYQGNVGPSDQHNSWQGTIAVTSPPLLTVPLTLTATDAYGNIAELSISVLHGAPPRLTVTAPESGAVARPYLPVHAICTVTGSGRCKVEINNTGLSLYSPVDTALVLNQASEGQQLTVYLIGFDTLGQSTGGTRVPVFVETSTALVDITTVHGPMLDVGPDSILFVRQTAGNAILSIHDRRSGADTPIFTTPGSYGPGPNLTGYLTATGAAFIVNPSTANAMAYSWESGQLVPLSAQTVRVNGRYVVAGTPGGATQTLLRRDVVLGQTTTIAQGANGATDLSPSGDVLYSAFDSNAHVQVFLFRNGSSTQLTHDSASNDGAVFAGAAIAYRKQTSSGSTLVLYDSTGEHLASSSPYAGDYFLLMANNSWLAYTKTVSGGDQEVFTRSPSGQEVQATRFGGSVILEAVGPNGEILAAANKRRFFALPDYSTPPRDISSSLGTATYENGLPQVVIGNELFQLAP